MEEIGAQCWDQRSCARRVPGHSRRHARAWQSCRLSEREAGEPAVPAGFWRSRWNRPWMRTLDPQPNLDSVIKSKRPAPSLHPVLTTGDSCRGLRLGQRYACQQPGTMIAPWFRKRISTLYSMHRCLILGRCVSPRARLSFAWVTANRSISGSSSPTARLSANASTQDPPAGSCPKAGLSKSPREPFRILPGHSPDLIRPNVPWMLAVIGANGAGKSTWCKHFSSVLPDPFFDADHIAHELGSYDNPNDQRRAREIVDRGIEDCLA